MVNEKQTGDKMVLSLGAGIITSNMMQRGLCTTRGNFHRKMYVLEDQKHFRCMTKLI